MHFENVRILGLHHVEPPNVVTSAEIERRLAPTMVRLGIPAGLLENLTGIVERRFWDAGAVPSDGAVLAARGAMAEAGLDPSRLGLLVNTSVTRDYVEPSTACIVHGKLGLPPTCMNFDVCNACLGFIDGMDIVASMVEKGAIETGIVVNAEAMEYGVESTIATLLAPDVDEPTFRSQFASLTLGSGAVAMVLGRADLAPEAPRYTGSVNLAATQHHNLCRAQRDWMETDTRALLVAGLELAGKTFALARRALQWTADHLDVVAMHQVSKTHTEKFAEIIGLDLQRASLTFPHFGNIGPASVPFALARARAQGRIHKGHRVGLMGIGSGLNCKMAEIAW